MNYKPIKRILKISVSSILLLILFLLLFLFVGLKTTFVQKKLGKIATKYLSKKLDTEVKIGQVEVYLFDKVGLKEVYFEDLKEDTLVWLKELSVDIDLKKIPRKTIEVDKVKMDEVIVNLNQNEAKEFNFQFIIDAFQPKEKNEKPKKNKSPWDIDVKKVRLTDIATQLNLIAGDQDIKLKSLELDINKLDLKNLIFDVDQLIIDQTSYIADLQNPNPNPKQPVNTDLFPLHTVPVQVSVNNLIIKESYTSILTKEVNVPKNQFNANHIIAENLNLEFKNVKVDSSEASVDVRNITTFFGNHLNINSLKGILKFAHNETSAQNLSFATNQSDVDLNAQLTYNNFGSFIKMNESVNVKVDSKPLIIHPDDVNYFAPVLSEFINFKPLSDKKIYATINASGTMSDLNIQSLDVKNGATSLIAKGRVLHPTNLNKQAFQNLSLKAKTSAKEIQRFSGQPLPKELNQFGLLNLNTNVSGKLSDLNIKNLNLTTNAQTKLAISGNIKNITDFKNLSYNVNINNIVTGIKDIEIFAKDLPEMLSQLDSINYQGTAIGTLNEFKLDGNLNTNLGQVSPNLSLAFNEDYSNAYYVGNVEIENFNLGKFLNNEELGYTSLTAYFDGSGLSLDTIKTVADVCLVTFAYKGYTYQDIELNGAIDKKKFTGDLVIDDPNLKFNFNGVMGLDNNLPEFDFQASLDTINVQALNLTQQPLSGSLAIQSKLSGNSLSNLQGDITLKDIKFNNGNYTWATDSIALVAKQVSEEINEMTLNAPFLDAKVVGNYQIDQLYGALMQTVDSYFPFSNLYKSDTTKSDTTNYNPQQFRAEIYVSDLTEISQLITPDLTEFDTASIFIDFDTKTRLIDIDVDAPKIVYGDIILKNALVQATTDEGILELTSIADSIKIGKQLSIPGMELNGAFSEGEGFYSFYIQDEKGARSLGTKGELKASNNLIELQIDPSFLLAGNEWALNTDGNFKIGVDIFEYPSFNLIKEDQGILMRKNDAGDIRLILESFEIDQILEYVLDDTTTSIRGSVTGNLDIIPSAEPPLIDGDVYISTIEYNGERVGNASIIFKNQGSTTDISMKLTDRYTYTSAEFKLGEGNSIDGKLDLEKFDINAITPFVGDLVTDAKGNITGLLKIDGTLKKPILTGNLELIDVSASVNSLGTYYTIQQGELDFDQNRINAGITFLDSLQRTALLSGQVYHNHFSDFSFNLNLNTNGFTLLNSKQKIGAPFYGRLDAVVDADIKGNLKRPDLFVTFSTIEETDITVAAFGQQDKITNESYVIFVDDKSYSAYEIDSIAKELYNIDISFDLTLYANINDKAKIKVIIDPTSGDYVTVKGNGNLVVELKESGELLVNGDYVVSSGQYRFSYQDLFLKWPFQIKPGSTLVFSGEIMNAFLDLTAFYALKASTYSLVEAEFESLSRSEQQSARALVPVEVLLNLDGQLSQPILTFDIVFPDDGSNANAINNAAERALVSLRSDENELYKQVFSLLVLQGFTSTNISSSNLASAGTQVAYNSVSNFINAQLSKLTSKANDGLEIGIDLASSSELTDEVNTTNTNIAAFVRQSLLNDRLVIGLGGNLDLESGNTSGGLTNVAGDFVLEYKITKDGNLRLSVFQKSDYDVLNEDNVWKSGVGLSYQKSFGKIIKNNEENQKSKKRKRKKEATKEEDAPNLENQ